MTVIVVSKKERGNKMSKGRMKDKGKIGTEASKERVRCT